MMAIPEDIHLSKTKEAIDSTEHVQPIPAVQGQSKPIWKIIVEIGSQIPDEEWAKVSDDASINLKHYLYGEPKKNA
ncbi:MAG: hypothetical protein O7E52_26550 [Candidatus Poribacteria bacterium]|nr:hypothetical protein [Candidatus Poribacteria bacterium]